MKTFILHWLTGQDETLTGETVIDAFKKAGYGAGSLQALDYWEEVKLEATP
jgi:hypothetical protein